MAEVCHGPRAAAVGGAARFTPGQAGGSAHYCAREVALASGLKSPRNQHQKPEPDQLTRALI